MAHLRTLIIGLAFTAACVGLTACADRHQIQRLPNAEGSFILVVDYVIKPFGVQDVIVSLEEKQGIATEVAVFRDNRSFSAAWLGPEDINICQLGAVQDYKTLVVVNAHDGNHSFHFQYSCSPT